MLAGNIHFFVTFSSRSQNNSYLYNFLPVFIILARSMVFNAMFAHEMEEAKQVSAPFFFHYVPPDLQEGGHIAFGVDLLASALG